MKNLSRLYRDLHWSNHCEGSSELSQRAWHSAGTILRHESLVRSAAFSTDGTRVVTASDDKTARIWDGHTGAAVGALLQHEDVVTSAAFSADGTRVVTASSDQTARLWDVSIGTSADAELLASLAEAVAGERVSDLGGVEPMTDQVERLAELTARSASQNPISSDPAFEAFFRWFFADVATRTISPLSTMTQEEYRLRMNGRAADALSPPEHSVGVLGGAPSAHVAPLVLNDADGTPVRVEPMRTLSL